MKRILLALVVAAALAPIAALAGASPSTTRAQQDCSKLRTSMGTAAFNQAYPNFGACVSAYAPVENHVQASAHATCTSQDSDPTFAATHDGKTFDQYYGTTADNGKGKSNAYGNCVSQKASGKTAQQQNTQSNAAKKCKAAPLKDQIGATPKTYRNFGACVAAQVKLAKTAA